MEKIIFLDIDGVLNSQQTFIDNHGIVLAYNKIINSIKDNISYIEYLEECFNVLLLDIDNEKIEILKQIVDKTNAKVVISSSWKKLRIYPLLEKYLIKKGIPVIGCTNNLSNRGEEIRDYLLKHNIKDYIIIDDERFPDFDEEQKYNLILTDFYTNGLEYDMIDMAVKKLVYK